MFVYFACAHEVFIFKNVALTVFLWNVKGTVMIEQL